MRGTCKIVNFSWLLFSTLVIGQNLLTQKNTLSKWSLRWLDTVFLSEYLSRLSVNYVAINKDLEKINTSVVLDKDETLL